MRSRPGELDKPVDVGNGSICASFGQSGAWLSIGMPHAGHGFVEFNGLPPFDEAWRGDADATRRYRAWMTDERYAFLRLEVDGQAPVRRLRVDLRDPACPRWHGVVGAVEIEARAEATADGLVQSWRLTQSARASLRAARIVVHGRLDRPALAEITEVNPPPPTAAATVLRPDGATLHVRADELPATVSVSAEGAAATWRLDGERAMLDLPARRSLAVAVTCSMRPPARAARARQRGSEAPAKGAAPTVIVAERPLVERALTYVRSCTALTVADAERTIVTDHRILPLSWTRDGYYQALLLLATGDQDDVARVADHLRWLWTRCERPDGRWMRSHHADGRRKDMAFQADQQIFPILELADYWRATGDLPRLGSGDWTGHVGIAWEAALAARDEFTGLIATAETAADDPAAAPFICASQILLAYAASRLAELAAAGALHADADELRTLAESVRAAVARHFVVEGPFGRQWAYAVDGTRAGALYHDANDLPTALAPAWGFCDSDDPVWRATMKYAFSPHNPGFAAGEPCPGLGSAHTPGAWTLGDVQAWLFARFTGDRSGADAALARLRVVAFDDGMLPEAYAVDDPSRRIRHWFAWPGAALSALLLLDRRGVLEQRLAAGSSR